LKPVNRIIYMPVLRILGRTGLLQKLNRVGAVSLYRNALYLVASSVITTSLGFFFWMIVARFYSTTEVGLGSAIISAMNLIALLSIFGLSSSLIRFLPQAVNPRQMINSFFTLSGIASLVIAVIFIVGTDFWSPALSFIKDNAIFFLAFLAMAVLFTLSPLVNSVFIARRRDVFVLFKDTTVSLLKIFLVIGFATFLHTFGVVASWTIALGTAVFMAILLFLPRVEESYKPVPSINLSQVRAVRRYTVSSYLISLLSRVPISILPLMVVNVLGTEDNAHFYVAWTIASLLSIVSLSISQSLFAEASHSQSDIKQNVTKSIIFTVILLMPALIVLIAAGKWILLAFGPSYSANALGLLWLLGISSIPRGIILIYSGVLRAQDRLRELLVIRSFIAAAVLIASWFVIPEYGIIGIGYIWLGVQVFVSIAIAPQLVRQASLFGRVKEEEWEDVDNF